MNCEHNTSTVNPVRCSGKEGRRSASRGNRSIKVLKPTTRQNLRERIGTAFASVAASLFGLELLLMRGGFNLSARAAAETSTITATAASFAR